ncbi:Gfo/Idh/MocA family oxidoreductase [bacterium]|nr:Gfo/Idh/MocA family oxidoreductase [bacterium]
MKKIKAGVAGYGRSGFYHHCGSLMSLPEQYEVVAVCDIDEGRRKEAEEKMKCRTYADYDEFLKDSEIELVSISTPSFLHTQHTISALNAGKHVVCEKPLSDNVADVDKMIQAAKQNNKVFAPFQNRRLDHLFKKVQEIVNSGVLGRIVEIKILWIGFGRRWDWQVFKKYMGGTLNDTCPHCIDWAMQFIPEDEPYELFCQLDKTLTLGDADDHVKIVLKSASSPSIDIEVTSSSAYKHQERLLIMGTKGGLKGNHLELWWKTANLEKLPERVLPTEPKTVERKYSSEDVEWKEEYWKVPDNAISWSVVFYDLLHKSLTEGAPLFITPESARRVIKVIEECHKKGGM